jgi:hypothetical protein
MDGLHNDGVCLFARLRVCVFACLRVCIDCADSRAAQNIWVDGIYLVFLDKLQLIRC